MTEYPDFFGDTPIYSVSAHNKCKCGGDCKCKKEKRCSCGTNCNCNSNCDCTKCECSTCSKQKS